MYLPESNAQLTALLKGLNVQQDVKASIHHLKWPL